MNKKLALSLCSLALFFNINFSIQASFKSSVHKILEGTSGISYFITDVSLIGTGVSLLGLGGSSIAENNDCKDFFKKSSKICIGSALVSSLAGYLSQKLAKYIN